jgi:hypothetical protein
LLVPEPLNSIYLAILHAQTPLLHLCRAGLFPVKTVVPLFYTFSAQLTIRPVKESDEVWELPPWIRRIERRELVVRLDRYGVLKVPVSFKRIRQFFKEKYGKKK